MRVAIIATGESMNQALADSIKHLPRVVISDAFRLAPDALALCANDSKWWRDPDKADAKDFAGRKFSTANVPGVERLLPGHSGIETSDNSGLLGLHVAITVYGATEPVLYGVDLTGSHYFGAHKTLPNTTPHRFEVFKQQFARYAASLPAHIKVFNASPISELRCFPFLP